MGGIMWIASYPKSGNTWLRAFLHNFLRGPERAYDINKLTDLTMGESQVELYRALDPEFDRDPSDERVRPMRPLVHRALSRRFPDTVLIKTHNALVEEDGYPLVNLEVTAGTVYLVRNPLDVAVSFSQHNRVTLDQMIEFMNLSSAQTVANDKNVYEFYGSWSEHVSSWTAQPSPTLHVMRYEDMLEAPQRTFSQLVKFLGIEAPRQRIERAIKLSSFAVLKEQERRHGFRERPAAMPAFFREGRAGQWRKALTPQQVAAVVAAHREQMTRFGYVPAGL